MHDPALGIWRLLLCPSTFCALDFGHCVALRSGCTRVSPLSPELRRLGRRRCRSRRCRVRRRAGAADESPLPTMRAPDAPIGCPIATAPPCRLTLSAPRPRRCDELSTTAENASLISQTAISLARETLLIEQFLHGHRGREREIRRIPGSRRVIDDRCEHFGALTLRVRRIGKHERGCAVVDAGRVAGRNRPAFVDRRQLCHRGHVGVGPHRFIAIDERRPECRRARAHRDTANIFADRGPSCREACATTRSSCRFRPRAPERAAGRASEPSRRRSCPSVLRRRESARSRRAKRPASCACVARW